jgi:hypothetical protein
MKILAFSHFDKNFEGIKDIVVPHNLEYYKKYNVEFMLFNGGYDELISNDNNGPLRNYWTKLFLLYNLLINRKDIDWFFMLDGDAIFCDFNVNLETIIRMTDTQKDFIACCLDSSAEDNYWNINTGALFFRNTQWMKETIEQILAIGQNMNFMAYEQVVLQNILRKNIMNTRGKIEIFPSRAFNHGDENCFIYHPCGISTSNQDQSVAIKHKEEELKRVIEIVRKKNENTLHSSL